VVDPAALADADVPPGTVIWTTFTGRSYEHRPPAATPDPAPREVLAAVAAINARHRQEQAATPMDEIYDQNTALSQWDRSRRIQAERTARAQQRAERTAGRRRTGDREAALPQEPPF
jgi:hypothetical protein